MTAFAPSVHVKKLPEVPEVDTDTVPATIAGPFVGVKAAFAGHKSQKTAPVLRAENRTLVTRKPYVGFGSSTAATHRLVARV